MTNARDAVVIGIGELLWDCFLDGRRPGGAPANVAWHATQLGARGLVVSRLGRDDDGDALRALLAGRGLDLDAVQVDDDLPTGRVEVDTTDAESPRYEIRRPAAWDALELTPALADVAARADAVCYGTLAQRDPRSREALHGFLAAAPAALCLYDVNLRQDFFARDWIERSLEAAHVVKLNEAEAEALAGMLDAPGASPARLAERFRRRYGVEVTCVTRGARGCVVFAPEETIEAVAEPVAVVDAVGAGDAFTAAFLTARLGGRDLEVAARFANAVGGLVAGRAGAMPELGDALRAIEDRILAIEDF